jgi:hypothetical protein
MRCLPNGEPLTWSLYAAGFPTCCVTHARLYFMVMWNLGRNHETIYRFSIN